MSNNQLNSNTLSYEPIRVIDGTSRVSLQSITAMPEFEQMSFEELRAADYQSGNKGGGIGLSSAVNASLFSGSALSFREPAAVPDLSNAAPPAAAGPKRQKFIAVSDDEVELSKVFGAHMIDTIRKQESDKAQVIIEALKEKLQFQEDKFQDQTTKFQELQTAVNATSERSKFQEDILKVYEAETELYKNLWKIKVQENENLQGQVLKFLEAPDQEENKPSHSAELIIIIILQASMLVAIMSTSLR
uniref:Uncharacterized protein n=1 Tax=Leptocylindrus danicus TaxID=163516 RepID=A0A7S2K6Z9_9STRA